MHGAICALQAERGMAKLFIRRLYSPDAAIHLLAFQEDAP
jgi:hypothetical protein